jgi:hypothetical protein
LRLRKCAVERPPAGHRFDSTAARLANAAAISAAVGASRHPDKKARTSSGIPA